MKRIKRILKKLPFLGKLAFDKRNKTKVTKAISGENNKIELDESSVLRHCKIEIEGNNNIIEIAKHCNFNNVTFYIKGHNHKIIIDKNVKFKRGGSLWIEDDNCQIIIGEFSTFEDVHIAVTEPFSKIEIGKDCMFAYDIDLRTGDSHSILDVKTNKRINHAKSIKIGDHVWVASHVSILKGVHISNNSVIATRSVVTKSFDEGNIAIGGSPAKKLKENITWDRRRI
ncbi:MAG: acyltransferase [Cytophagaceae bacterium]